MRETETILVIDDELHIRTILTYMLEQEDFRVIQASCGAEALVMLEDHLPDLVLLDIMMPDMDGFSVLSRIRGQFRTHNLPVILLTARGETDQKVRGLQAGANDYLIKPFVPEELLLRVRNMLQLSRNQRDANPLTGLPGNRAIDQELRRRLDGEMAFGFCYCDLDHFKAYNDYYGYARGDRVLSMLAEILTNEILKLGSGAFLGHVGGDDFVAITGANEAEIFAERVITEFDNRIQELYEPVDWSRGFIELPDRGGDSKRFPPVSLTAAAISDRDGRFGHVGRLNAVAAELKQYGKAQPGSVVVAERRGARGVVEPVVTRHHSETD
ncbi:response regulator [bacterium]|nr:response regulator [bacterium]MBU1073594.1 response regulator [bacterium]